MSERLKRKVKSLPPLARLQALFQLDENTGYLRYKYRAHDEFPSEQAARSWNAKNGGESAGYGDKTGYRRVKIDGQVFFIHRVIYALYNNEDPGEKQIDHIDGNPSNNCPHNLRSATQSENMFNKGRQSNNKTGVKGVIRWGKRFCAQIGHRGNRLRIGIFDDIEDAKEAYASAARKFHGDFARTE